MVAGDLERFVCQFTRLVLVSEQRLAHRQVGE